MNRFSSGALLSMLLVGSGALAAGNAPPGSARAPDAPAATGVSLTNVSSFEDPCGGVRYNATLTFTGTSNDGGGNDTVWLVIFDDSIEKFAQPFTAPVNQQRSHQIAVEYPGSVGTVVPGIGIYVRENRSSGDLLVFDPFLPTRLSTCTIGGTAPTLGFNPTINTIIAYGSNGSASPIGVINAGGGSGSGPAATTTLSNCVINSGGAAFPTNAFNPNVSAIGSGNPSPASFSLPNCVPQAAAVTTSLQCAETRGSGGTVTQRFWTLTCPAGAAPVAPPRLGNPTVDALTPTGALPNGNSQAPSLSRTGNRVAYTSDASNIVAGDANGKADIFVRDRVTATTTRVSQLADPLSTDPNDVYDDPAISADGNVVAFTGITTGQVFAAAAGVGRKISANSAGVLGNADSANPFPTSDGSLVFFDSRASNLLSGSDGNGNTADIFVKNLGNESVTLITRGPNGEPADGPSSAPSASADGQTIVFHTLATNIVPSGAPTPIAFSQNFDAVTAPALPSGWSAQSPVSGNGLRWVTSAGASPPAASLPNSASVDEEGVVSNKLLDSPLLTLAAQPATLSFRRFHDLEVDAGGAYDGLVLELSVNGGGFIDAIGAGGTFTQGGYTGVISSNFSSPIAGRNAWTGATGGSYATTVYTLPGNIASGSSVRFRWRLATDLSVAGNGARIDSITSTNLTLPSTVVDKLPPGVKAGTIQQATMMRGGGFGNIRLFLSRNRTTGELGNGDSTNVKVTPDGRWAVFESDATNLIAGDTNGVKDIFRVEVVNSQVVGMDKVTQTKNGEQANGNSFLPQISDDGLLITFQTEATNLVPPDTNGQPDVMVKSMITGDVLRMSQTTDGQEPNGLTVLPTISGDGSTLGFCTLATNVAPGDNNNAADMLTSSIQSGLPRDEPGLVRFVLPTPNPPNANCPSGFFSAVVDDGPGSGLSPGAFGVEVLLDDPGTRVLAGGLNFGGLIDVSQEGFAAFNIANPANESQRLNLSLRGSPSSSSSASYPVRVRIERRTATTSEAVFDSTQTISLATPFSTSIELPPAFYVATVRPTSGDSGGVPEGQFFFELTTSFINRPGGGFQGGAIVGGYHATHPFGGVSGFAAFCLATPHTTSVRVVSAPTYGPAGAGDLRLRMQDAQQRDVVVVPSN
jgi:Tol biopolymer transport system component